MYYKYNYFALCLSVDYVFRCEVDCVDHIFDWSLLAL